MEKKKPTGGWNDWEGIGSGHWKEGDGSNARKIEVMRLVVEQKILQHDYLKNLLWETGDKEIIEESPIDDCWGNARGGKNWLGRILIEVREKIINERGKYNPTTEPKTKTGEGDTADKEKEKKALIEKNIREIRIKLQEAGISSEQENKILNAGISTNNWERDYRKIWENGSEEEIEGFKKALLKEINEFITKNSSNSNGSNNNSNNNQNNNGQNQNEGNQRIGEPNGQPTQPEPSPSFSQPNPEPTQQQVNNAKDKLDQVQGDNIDEEEIVRVIKEISETVKNSGDENLKKQKEEIEKKLSKDKLREIIQEEIKSVLAEEKIKPEQLNLKVKQKLDELNNNNNNNNNNDQATRTEIFNEIGNQSLSKLINEVEKVLKLGKKVLEGKVAELKKFINSKIGYKRQAYKLQKDKVEKLLAQAQSKLVQNKDNEGFLRLNNPMMWVSGVVIISLAVGIGLLVVRVRRKRKQR